MFNTNMVSLLQNKVYFSELMLRNVLALVHYLPDSWVNKAHTSHVHDEFSRFFQIRIVSEYCL